MISKFFFGSNHYNKFMYYNFINYYVVTFKKKKLKTTQQLIEIFPFPFRLGDEQESEDISDRIASHLAGDSDDHVSNEDVRITKERRVWSREAFTHETAGMGGPDVEVRPRYVIFLL